MTTYAALGFAVLVLVAAGFQGALAAGAPWGDLAWGGRYSGRLPARMRAMSALSALLLLLFGAIVASRAGLAFPGLQGLAGAGIWGVVGYCVLGVLANAATPSRRERALWLPVTVLLLACSLVVALARAPGP